MEAAIRAGLQDAGLSPGDVGYVNGHATGTEAGDRAEAAATAAVFGDRAPVSSTKGATGHTLGACGALELVITGVALRRRQLPPCRNLDEVDDACAGLDLVAGAPRATEARFAVSHNFAFGGINTSLVVGLG